MAALLGYRPKTTYASKYLIQKGFKFNPNEMK